jgi:hypothetical protein
MNRRTLIIIVVVLFVLPCICTAPVIFAAALPEGSDFAEVIQTTFLIGGCVGLPLLAGAGLVWTLRNLTRGRHSAGRVAEEMNLERLNDTDKLVRRWYGGTYKGYDFGITPSVLRERSYNHEGRSRMQATFYLRVALGLQKPIGVKLVRDIKSKADANSFEQAFTVQQNTETLSLTAKQALLTFVQKGYPKGLHGKTLRTSEQTRNLQLYDRAALSENFIPVEIMPNVGAILIHDHPDAAVIDQERLEGVLDDLIEIAQALES